jgi:hypothetical protein
MCYISNSPRQLIRHSLHVTISYTSRTVSSIHRTVHRKHDSKCPQHMLTFDSCCCCKQPFPFQIRFQRTTYVRPFRDSLCGVPVKTTPNAERFFLDFGLLRSSEYEGSALIVSTGMYPLFPGVSFGAAALTQTPSFTAVKARYKSSSFHF